MAEKQPWMKWYPADWRQEPRLRMCERAARSLWADMLGLMHEAEPYGHLVIDGRPVEPAQLAAILGDREKDTRKWLEILEKNGVFSRTDEGIIFSRRMVRDRARSEQKQAVGRLGGSPLLKQQVNHEVNGHDKPQMPEARDQKPDKEYARDFDDWLAAYPRRVSKGRARKAYAAARKKTDAATLLAAAQRAAAKYAGTEPQFIPHPATWLNDERWLDEATPTPQAKPDPGQPAAEPWDARVRAFKADRDAGKARPFWSAFWGPSPLEPGCAAPREVLDRHGFGRLTVVAA